MQYYCGSGIYCDEGIYCGQVIPIYVENTTGTSATSETDAQNNVEIITVTATGSTSVAAGLNELGPVEAVGDSTVSDVDHQFETNTVQAVGTASVSDSNIQVDVDVVQTTGTSAVSDIAGQNDVEAGQSVGIVDCMAVAPQINVAVEQTVGRSAGFLICTAAFIEAPISVAQVTDAVDDMQPEFVRLLPPNLQGDINLSAIGAAADRALEFDLSVLLTRNIDTVNASVLPFLAWEFHVEGYDEATTDDERRSLIKNSLVLHRYKGTRWAVERVLALLGFDGTVVEWFEDGSAPYTFRLELNNGSRSLQTDDITRLVSRVGEYKNVRSQLSSIRQYRNAGANLYNGGAVMVTKKTTLRNYFHVNMPVSTAYIGGAVMVSRKMKLAA